MAISIERLKKLEISYMLSGRLTNSCKEVGISFSAGKKYCEKLNWKEKRKKILSKLEKKEEIVYEDFFRENITLIKELKKKYRAVIPKVKLNPKNFSINELDRLVRLEAFLFGFEEQEENRGMTIIVHSTVPRADKEIVVDENETIILNRRIIPDEVKRRKIAERNDVAENVKQR